MENDKCIEFEAVGGGKALGLSREFEWLDKLWPEGKVPWNNW